MSDGNPNDLNQEVELVAPMGSRLIGNLAVYDLGLGLPTKLDFRRITKYDFDLQNVYLRQIAANNDYLCYGLKMGDIRVLHLKTGSKLLLEGHRSRISDIAFLAEDVHHLASANINGQFCVWELSEGLEEVEARVIGKTLVAIQVQGCGDAVHPRVCWCCRRENTKLVIGMATQILIIDTIEVGKPEYFSAMEPLKFSIENLIDGIQLVGTHDGEITDLSVCQNFYMLLVSASNDGTIKLWDIEDVPHPLFSLKPHDGNPVSSAKFLTAKEDHIILITGGSHNQEIKFWDSTDEDGWILSGDAKWWKCIQTLQLRSSSEPRPEEAFFTQLMTFSQPGLLLFASAKKNIVYAVHIRYGSDPASTRMDSIAEFHVQTPIQSFTGISEQQIVQMYCVETKAVRKYALKISQCLPPPLDDSGLEKVENLTGNEIGVLPSNSLSLGTTSSQRPLTQKEARDTTETNEIYFSSQASDIGIQMSRKCPTIQSETDVEVTKQIARESDPPPNLGEEPFDSPENVMGMDSYLSIPISTRQTEAITDKEKGQEDKHAQASAPSFSSPSASDSFAFINEQALHSDILSLETVSSQIRYIQELLSVLQKTQTEAATLVAPVTKEGKRERALSVNEDIRIANLITDLVDKKIPSMIRDMVKRELADMLPNLAIAITREHKKTKSSVIEAFEEALKSSLQSSVLSEFELCCQAMSKEVVTSEKGIIEHVTAALKELETRQTHAHAALDQALLGLIDSVYDSVHQSLNGGELAETRRKLIENVVAGLRALTVDPLVSKPSDSPLSGLHDNDKVKAPLDPTEKLSKLISERKYEEAFTDALERRDVMVLCSQVDLQTVLLTTPMPLSQRVVFSLLHELALDIHTDTPIKLAWMTDVVTAIVVPVEDLMCRPLIEKVSLILNNHSTAVGSREAKRIMLIKNVIQCILKSFE